MKILNKCLQLALLAPLSAFALDGDVKDMIKDKIVITSKLSEHSVSPLFEYSSESFGDTKVKTVLGGLSFLSEYSRPSEIYLAGVFDVLSGLVSVRYPSYYRNIFPAKDSFVPLLFGVGTKIGYNFAFNEKIGMVPYGFLGLQLVFQDVKHPNKNSVNALPGFGLKTNYKFNEQYEISLDGLVYNSLMVHSSRTLKSYISTQQWGARISLPLSYKSESRPNSTFTVAPILAINDLNDPKYQIILSFNYSYSF